jgi:hypothetical protein
MIPRWSYSIGHLTAPVAVAAVVETHGWFVGTYMIAVGWLEILVAGYDFEHVGPVPANGMILSKDVRKPGNHNPPLTKARK